MSGKRLVIVESPTKARTIRKFLGNDYIVESCMGHVRDLPQSAKDIPDKYKKQPWANLGVNVDNDFEPLYCVPKNKTKVVKELKDKLKEADELILATDEDREGESISWHLLELLNPKVKVKRMVFHEITKEAIQKALKDFRELDINLVRAQEARRVLDRLVGYSISPLLWKKVAYGLSAGRVQSVAVRLIAEREHERIRFKKSEYWGVLAQNEKDQVPFESRLKTVNGKRVATGKDFDGETGALINDKKQEILALDGAKAQSLLEEARKQEWKVVEVEEKPVSRRPAAPFITSTLQQEANRKLGWSSRETMQTAQKLYEQGYITYMRTDSTFLSKEAIDATRNCIQKLYGKDYLPPEPRNYAAKKVKGAQEAHEAIRPAGTQFATPDDTGLSGSLLRLYDLIWKRTVASQMKDAQQKQVKVSIHAGSLEFTTSGMTIEFPGFLKAYVEGHDDPDAALDEREVRLPKMKVGDLVHLKELKATQHETKPPARYTEATLVQTMEKEGIGRPSTYASIIGTIQDRGYVKKVGNALVPTFTALVVSKLLKNHLPNFVDLGFTSQMEKSLDDIASGEMDWVEYLSKIYFGKEGLKNQVETREQEIDSEESRQIQLEGLQDLVFRIGRYGAYVCRKEEGQEVCASIPESHLPGEVSSEVAHKLIDQKVTGADSLGKDPDTGLPVYVLTGRYGPYVQLGEVNAEDPKEKPKRVSVPAGIDPETLDFKMALKILELPKTLGQHPSTGKEIKKGLGRFGPYVVHDGDFRSIPKTMNLFDVELKEALDLLSQPKKGRGAASPLRELGAHPQTGEVVQLFSGKYGPYVKLGKTNASIPEGTKVEDVSLKMALELLHERDKKLGADKGAKATKKAKVSPKKKGAKKKASRETQAPTAGTTAKKKIIRRSKSS